MFRLGARRSLASEQLFALCFGLLAVMNICRGPDPLYNPSLRVADRNRARQVPSVLSVLAAKTILLVEGLSCLDRLPHPLLHAFKVIRVNRLHPLASDRLLNRKAYILAPLLIGVINQPVRAAGVNDLGHGVGELAEARLALAYRLLGQNAICDVQNRADHTQRRALRVIEDTAPGFDPSQFASVSAQYPILRREFFEPMLVRILKARFISGDFTWVNASAPIFVCAG